MSMIAARRTGHRTLVLLAVAAIGLFIAACLLHSGAATRLRQQTIHQYGGTTWIGDTCYVDRGGTLWCSTSG